MVGIGDIVMGMVVGAGLTYAYDHGWITLTPPPVTPAAYGRAYRAYATAGCPRGRICYKGVSGIHCRCR